MQVDTPERGACWFTAATKRTATLLPVGKRTYLLADKEPKDHYGRSLFYAWTAGGVFVNRNLVRYEASGRERLGVDGDGIVRTIVQDRYRHLLLELSCRCSAVGRGGGG
ncbi:hypothetical protein [Streptosporangium sp. NPDC006930]|uniref:hypothetical protein n=1 Tax=unclassified Streptosporangium TaxID=2632669 RepID=UPI0034223011